MSPKIHVEKFWYQENITICFIILRQLIMLLQEVMIRRLDIGTFKIYQRKVIILILLMMMNASIFQKA
jgi:hypothetical protein